MHAVADDSIRSTDLAGPETYYHPVGAEVTLPVGWTVQSGCGMTVLAPPQHATDSYGPIEAYLMLVDGCDQMGADKPTLVELMDGEMSQLAPFLRRSAVIRFEAGQHSGVTICWSGTSEAGMSVEAQMHCIACEGKIGAVLAFGELSCLEMHGQALRQIAGSMSFDT
jgi:hypothetical protein